jgi:hypothetical protein
MTNYIKADGFDLAMIGIDAINERIIYSKQKMIEILSEEMTDEEAIEFLEYNTWNTYVGEHTPIYCDEMTMEELEERLEDEV